MLHIRLGVREHVHRGGITRLECVIRNQGRFQVDDVERIGIDLQSLPPCIQSLSHFRKLLIGGHLLEIGHVPVIGIFELLQKGVGKRNLFARVLLIVHRLVRVVFFRGLHLPLFGLRRRAHSGAGQRSQARQQGKTQKCGYLLHRSATSL